MLGISSIGNYYLDTEESLFFIDFFFSGKIVAGNSAIIKHSNV